MLIIMAPTKAVKKLLKNPPVSDRESLSHTVNISIKVLMTNVNNPSVAILMGRVNSLTNGRMSALIRPNTIPMMIKLIILPEKTKPDNSKDVIQIATALMIIRKMSFIFSSVWQFGATSHRFLL